MPAQDTFATSSRMPPEWRAADAFVRNLPPRDSVCRDNEDDLRNAERLVDLAYAWGQLEIAETALLHCYERLRLVEDDQLPVRTLKQRVNRVKQAVRTVTSLIPRKNQPGSERQEAEVCEGQVL